MKKHGTLSRPTIQPGRPVAVDENGMLTASIIFVCDRGQEGLAPRINSRHPEVRGMIAWRRRIIRQSAELSEIEVEYIGLTSDPTTPVVNYPGNSGLDPIETHPNFKQFAGDPATSPDQLSRWVGSNGAVFDPILDAEGTENFGWEFVGFLDPAFTKYGVESYNVPNHIVYLTYLTFGRPRVSRVNTIRSSLPRVRRPNGVKNWLCIGVPYQQIGPLYQVTEQWLGSGPNGWDTDIYG